jgi:hypothetical protein
MKLAIHVHVATWIGTSVQYAVTTQTKKGNQKMIITPSRAKAIRMRYEQLLEKASSFTGRSTQNLRFDYEGNIEAYKNHACHCHPECYWDQEKTAAEFEAWLAEDAKKEAEYYR